jgi:hypothetical protein
MDIYSVLKSYQKEDNMDVDKDSISETNPFNNTPVDASPVNNTPIEANPVETVHVNNTSTNNVIYLIPGSACPNLHSSIRNVSIIAHMDIYKVSINGYNKKGVKISSIYTNTASGPSTTLSWYMDTLQEFTNSSVLANRLYESRDVKNNAIKKK